MFTRAAIFDIKEYSFVLVCLAFMLTACGGGGGGGTNATLASIQVTPATASIANGTAQQFKATGIYSDSSTQDLTSSVVWSSNTNGVTVNSIGLATGVTASATATTLTATSGTISGTASLTVTDATLASLQVTPATASIGSGDTQQFTATGTFSDNSTQDLSSTVVWTSNPGGIIAINAGLATGVVEGGPVTITATSGVFSSTASITVAPAISLASVSALFPNFGSNWNDYVSGDASSATDVACDAATDTACLHGGERRVVVATGKTTCTGLTAADKLGAFDWVCDASTDPVRMISTGLKDGMGLSDLIDFGTPGFMNNKVTVYNNGIAWGVTPSSTWWTNPVEVNNTGGSLATASTIYLVTINPAAAITLDADKVALLIDQDLTITGPGTSANVISSSSHDHLWLEGSIDATGDYAGVSLDMARFSMLRKLTANNGTTGVSLSNSSNNNTLTDVTASNNGSNGVELNYSSNNNTLTDVTASNNGSNGVELNYSSNNNTLTDVTANNNYNGVYLYIASNNTLTDLTASNNGSIGVGLNSSLSNTLTGVTASNNHTGVHLYFTSNNNTLAGVTASNNTLAGVWLADVSNNTLTGVTASNNSQFGVSFDNYASNNILIGVTVSNTGQGIYLFDALNNALTGVTVSNNVEGISLFGASDHNTLTDVTTSNNSYGVSTVYGLNNTFAGLLKVGSNALYDCFDNNLNDCQTGSTASQWVATLTPGITLADAFVGKVSVDAANVNGPLGTADYPGDPAAFDWSHFDNFYRGWGIDGSPAFPNADQQGQWTTGTGRIWDWSLRATDSVNRAVVVTLPTGDDTMTHTWSDATVTTFLKNAVEIPTDGIGNDNGMCESGETCLFTPNIGSYQGSGDLVSAGAFTDGTLVGGLTGITLMKFATNGEADQPPY
jgi:parallel beta-helix repeat protein